MKSFGQVGLLDMRCMSVCRPLAVCVGNVRFFWGKTLRQLKVHGRALKH